MGSRPLGTQPKAIDKVPSIGLDRADRPNDLSVTGSDESQIAQELTHRMQAMESEVRELRKENAELRSSTRNPQPRGQTPPRQRSRSKSRSPPRRTQRPQSPPQARRTQQPQTPLGGDDTTVVRATVTPPREGTAIHVGGPTGVTKELEIGLLPHPSTVTLHSQVGF
ncbi:hypothetical protein PIB30_095431 [Stylosanthes scabra]|uniref:Uncharacterized protein n=1 Tax=Stylosanthes scabra TaxID=79078 RepID=A0ABU6WWT5_9FABA|nr:hypothetical protein [Stylosanthes scabra]